MKTITKRNTKMRFFRSTSLKTAAVDSKEQTGSKWKTLLAFGRVTEVAKFALFSLHHIFRTLLYIIVLDTNLTSFHKHQQWLHLKVTYLHFSTTQAPV